MMLTHLKAGRPPLTSFWAVSGGFTALRPLFLVRDLLQEPPCVSLFHSCIVTPKNI